MGKKILLEGFVVSSGNLHSVAGRSDGRRGRVGSLLLRGRGSANLGGVDVHARADGRARLGRVGAVAGRERRRRRRDGRVEWSLGCVSLLLLLLLLVIGRLGLRLPLALFLLVHDILLYVYMCICVCVLVME